MEFVNFFINVLGTGAFRLFKVEEEFAFMYFCSCVPVYDLFLVDVLMYHGL